MIILPNAAIAPSLLPTAAINAVQNVSVPAAGRGQVTAEASTRLGDTVELSSTAQLFSSVARIVDMANSVDEGKVLNSASLIDEARRFVDSVNALNLGAQLADTPPAALSTLAADTTTTQPAAGLASPAPGINIMLASSNRNSGDTFSLRLDDQALAAAIATAAGQASNQLAAFAIPLGASVAARTGIAAPGVRDADAGGRAAEAAADNVQAASRSLRLGSELPEVPVPDLSIENLALTDRMLNDDISLALNLASQLSSSMPLPVPAPTVSIALERRVETAPLESDASASAAISGIQRAAVRNTSTLSAMSVANANVQATAAPLLLESSPALTAQALVTTPLEQIAQLALNPTVAGAVAAFQIVNEDVHRAARLALRSGADAINPLEAVSETEAVAPNLANSSGQRRDRQSDTRLNAWLTTRPGLL